MLPRHAFIYSIAKIARDGKFEINKTLLLWPVPYPPPKKRLHSVKVGCGLLLRPLTAQNKQLQPHVNTKQMLDKRASPPSLSTYPARDSLHWRAGVR